MRCSIDNLKKSAATGTIITGGITMIMRPINFVASLYLLRILNPDDFGVVALAMLLLTTSNLFSDLGLGAALIHSDDDKGTIAFQAFVTTMAFAAVLFIVLTANITFFANLLGAPEIAPVLRWLSLFILIDPASTIPTSLLRKDLMFDKVGLSSFLAEITLTAVQLGLALLGFGLWSLVAGRLASALVKTVTSWWFYPGWEWLKPKKWDMVIYRRLLNYGLRNTGSGVVAYFHTHIDDWLVGRIMGTVALGFYSKSYDLTHNTINRLGRNVISVVFFPSYAKIRADGPRLRRAYQKSVQLILLMMTPMAFGILAIAPEMVRVLWGGRWLPMVPVLQIYALAILTRPVSENAAPLFQALGKPQYNTRAGFALLIVMLPLAILLLGMGISGVAIAVATGHFVGMAYNVYQANVLLPGSAGDTVKAMLPTVSVGALMAAAVHGLINPVAALVGGVVNTVGLILLVLAGVVIYTVAIFLLQRPLITEIYQTGMSIIGPKLRLTRYAPQ